MTNETTASQPNEPHWIDGEQSSLGGKTAREGYAANPEYAGLYPAASQPKSIGDDTQFLELLKSVGRAIEPSQEEFFKSKLVELIDSRALAAQASATIQAAPDAWSVERLPGSITIRNGAGNCLATTAEGHDAESIVRAHNNSLAATIQEPVMVAEPVEEGWPTNAMISAGFKAGLSGKIGSGFRAMQAAAPMVADPAGVALQTAAALLRPLVQDGVEVRIKHARPVLAAIDKALAATVKAVPSEALAADCPSCDASTRFICHRCKGREKIAAPLADKTGGDQCTVPPAGWSCSRAAGHEGPCAASATNGGE